MQSSRDGPAEGHVFPIASRTRCHSNVAQTQRSLLRCLSHDESVLLYEGHDVRRDSTTPDPKRLDQPRFEKDGKPTQNGQFADWVDQMDQGRVSPAFFRVYEKMRSGVWTDRGLYLLKSYDYRPESGRRVFKFRLEQADFDSSSSSESSSVDLQVSRQIPSWLKQSVYKRDRGQCVICGETDQLHFDHDFPFSKGGTSIVPENVRILCARHNLEKSAFSLLVPKIWGPL